MITIRITNEVILQKYLKNGLKIFVNYNKDKTKWFIIKLDKHQLELLKFIIEVITSEK